MPNPEPPLFNPDRPTSPENKPGDLIIPFGFIPPGTSLGLSDIEKQKHNKAVYEQSLREDKEKTGLLLGVPGAAAETVSKHDSLFGKATIWAHRTISDLLTIPYYSGGDPEPLNIPGNEKRVSEWASKSRPPSDYPFAFSTSAALSPDNNKEKIEKETAAFSFEAQGYLFSAPNYASYLERLDEMRLRQLVDDETIPTDDWEAWSAKAADLGLFMLSAEFTLPIALAGGSARIGAMADLVAGSTTARGMWQTSKLAQEAAAQAAKMSRVGLFTRGAAVATAEMALYEAAKAGADPLDEYTSYEFLNTAFWGSLLGGGINTVFGRKFLRYYIEEGVGVRQAQARYARGDGETAWTYRWEAAPTTARHRRLVSGKTYKPMAQKLEYFKDIFYGSQEARVSAIQSLRQLLAQESGRAGTGVGMPERNELVNLFYQLWNRVQEARFEVGVAEGTRLQQLRSDGTVNFVAWYNKSGLQGLPVFTALEEITQRTGGRSVSFEVFRDVLEETSKIGQMVQDAVRVGAAVDDNVIRAGMAEIINRHLPETGLRISVYDETLQQFNLLSFAAKITKGLGSPLGSNVTGLTLGDIPQSTGFGSSLPFGLSDHLNQAAVLLKNQNPAVRLIGFMAKHASRHLPLPQGLTIGETGQMALNQTLRKVVSSYRRGVLSEATGEAEISFMSRKKLLEEKFSDPLFIDRFNRQILKYLDTGEEVGLSAAAVRSAKEIRSELRYFAEEAFQRKIPGFTKSTMLHYSPWIWKWDLIRQLKTAEGRNALKELLLRSFGTAENGQRTVYLDGELHVFADAPQAAKILADRLVDLSEYAGSRPYTAIDDELRDAINGVSAPLKETRGSPTPFGMNRIILDRSVSVPTSQDFLSLGRNSMSLDDLREVDIPFILKKYFTSMQGAINEADFLREFSGVLTRSGIELKDLAGKRLDKFTGVDQILGFLRSTTQQSGHELGPAILHGSVEERAINSLMGYLRFEPVVANPNIMDKLVGIGGLLSYLRFGGKFALAGATEIARVTGTLGLESAIKQFPILEEMLVNWRSMSATNKNFASCIEALCSPAVGRILRLDRHNADVLVSELDRARGGKFLDKASSRLAKVSDVYSDITLLPAVTSFSQILAGATLIQHLYDASSSAFRLKPAQLSLLGITEHQYNVLIDYVKRNGVVTDTYLGKRVISLSENVEPATENLLKNFTYRFINTKIQSVPTRGDFADHMFSWLGRALLQFKTFNLKGIDNFLLANTQRALHGDALAVGREYLNVAILSSIILSGRHYATLKSAEAAGADRKTLQALRENLSLRGIIKSAWVGPVESGISTYFIDPFWTSFVDPDPIFGNPYSYGARQGSIFDILGPTGLQIKNVSSTGLDAVEAMMHELAPSWPMGKMWTQTEQKQAEQTFLPNLLGLKEIMDAFVLPALREKLNLRQEQPRGSAPKKDQDPLSFFK